MANPASLPQPVEDSLALPPHVSEPGLYLGWAMARAILERQWTRRRIDTWELVGRSDARTVVRLEFDIPQFVEELTEKYRNKSPADELLVKDNEVLIPIDTFPRSDRYSDDLVYDLRDEDGRFLPSLSIEERNRVTTWMLRAVAIRFLRISPEPLGTDLKQLSQGDDQRRAAHHLQRALRELQQILQLPVPEDDKISEVGAGQLVQDKKRLLYPALSYLLQLAAEQRLVFAHLQIEQAQGRRRVITYDHVWPYMEARRRPPGQAQRAARALMRKHYWQWRRRLHDRLQRVQLLTVVVWTLDLPTLVLSSVGRVPTRPRQERYLVLLLSLERHTRRMLMTVLTTLLNTLVMIRTLIRPISRFARGMSWRDTIIRFAASSGPAAWPYQAIVTVPWDIAMRRTQLDLTVRTARVDPIRGIGTRSRQYVVANHESSWGLGSLTLRLRLRRDGLAENTLLAGATVLALLLVLGPNERALAQAFTQVEAVAAILLATPSVFALQVFRVSDHLAVVRAMSWLRRTLLVTAGVAFIAAVIVVGGAAHAPKCLESGPCDLGWWWEVWSRLTWISKVTTVLLLISWLRADGRHD